jgi:hypothetical protein
LAGLRAAGEEVGFPLGEGIDDRPDAERECQQGSGRGLPSAQKSHRGALSKVFIALANIIAHLQACGKSRRLSGPGCTVVKVAGSE